jgi:hypothetical protein
MDGGVGGGVFFPHVNSRTVPGEREYLARDGTWHCLMKAAKGVEARKRRHGWLRWDL